MGIFTRFQSHLRLLLPKGQTSGYTAPPESYASHIPVLIGFARIFNVRQVLELGCGVFSTQTLLNKRAFSDLINLRSLENNQRWAKKVAAMVRNDQRCKVEIVSGEVYKALNNVSLDRYDLILVDDSPTYEQRALTISTIAKQKPLAGVVLIHDFESPLYQQASIPFSYRFNFDALLPNTGAHWNHNRINISRLEQLNEMILRSSKSISPLDVEGWVRLFDVSK